MAVKVSDVEEEAVIVNCSRCKNGEWTEGTNNNTAALDATRSRPNKITPVLFPHRPWSLVPVGRVIFQTCLVSRLEPWSTFLEYFLGL
jgi:hypothetical protein